MAVPYKLNYFEIETGIDSTSTFIHSGDLTANKIIKIGATSNDILLGNGTTASLSGLQPTGNYITALTGEATATGPGSVAITLTNSAVIGKLLTGLSITGSTIAATDTILQAFGKVQNQINGKQGTITLTTTGTSGAATLIANTLNIPQYTDAFVGTVTSVSALTLGTTGTDLSSTVANSTTTPVITLNVPTASATNRGALSSTDWTTFNSKQDAGNYITSLTGEATASGPGAASVTLGNTAVIGKVLTGLNVTGGTVISTDSILAAFGKVQNQINGLVGGSIFQGTWDASTNTPALASSVGTNGYYYIVSVDGSTNLNGITDWKVGDWAIFAGTAWQKVDNTDSVASVNGYTGTVSLVTGDVLEGAGSLPSRPSQLYFTDARARAAISLTTSGSSGASTYDSATGVFNIPNYGSALTGYVPYTGATANVALGEYGLSGGFLTFDTTPTGTPTSQGTMYWDDSKSTVALIMNGTLQHIGQDQFYYAKNSTGSSIPKGTAVRFAGTDGASGHILITPMLADGSVPSSYYMGITSEAIANGGFGQVLAFGELSGFNTSSYSAGALLYVSTTVAGGFQTTAPIAPNNIILAAATLNSKNNGELIVRATLGSNINNDEGVKIVSPTTGDLLQLQSGGLWENKTKAQILGGTSSQFVKGDASLDSTSYQPLLTNPVTGTGTTNEITYWTGTSTVGSLSTATYPSLTELSYVKGVTSAIQTQLNSKQATITLTTTGSSGAATFIANTLNVPDYGSALSGYLPLTGGTLLTTNTTETLRIVNAGTGYGLFVQSDSYFQGIVTFQSGFKSTTNTFTLPSATGTLALTSDLSAYLPLTGGTLTGALSGTSASFSATSQFLDNTGASTTTKFIRISNTSGDMAIGVEGSTPSQIVSGSGGIAYSTVLKTVSTTALILGTNSIAALTLNGSTQAATFSSSATATAFIPSSATIPTNGMYLSAANTLDFATNSTNRLSISSGGVATFTASVTPLILKSTSATTMYTEYYYNTSTLSGYIGSGSGILSGANNSDFIIRSEADFVVATGGNNRRLTITSGGNVGIGTSSPANPAGFSKVLNISGTDASLVISNTNGTAKNYTIGVVEAGNLLFLDGTTTRLAITSAGYTWVNGAISGFTGSGVQFQVNGQSRMGGTIILHNTSNAAQTATFNCTSASTVTIADNVVIVGSLSKGSGSFRIEHPLPSLSETHQLVHSFVEAPKADLIYRGKLTLVNGKAQANIDEVATMTEGTFEALCREVQCFTTNESGWDLVKGKVIGNIIYIESQNENSTDEISWMVIGERKDKHMMETGWTDENGKVIVEPLKPIEQESMEDLTEVVEPIVEEVVVEQAEPTEPDSETDTETQPEI